jgi:hypothetical protein
MIKGDKVMGEHNHFTGDNNIRYLPDDFSEMCTYSIHEAASHGTDKYITPEIRQKYEELLNYLQYAGNKNRTFSEAEYGSD